MLSMQEYMSYDGLGLAELIQQKQIQPIELLQIAISRCEQVNPALNAVITTMYEQAEQRACQPLSGPFAGVPFLLKDLFQEYAGVLASYGSNTLKKANYKPHFNAEIVNRWQQAGTVIFGRTNVPEFGLKGITEPAAWGPTHNPWHLKHNTGGSSGGAAAAVAAGIVPIAGASDGGGSIRLPASYCGLFGLKPSRGRTPWGPVLSESLHGAAVQHVLTRSVRDSAAMLDATHGADLNSSFKIAPPAGRYLDCIYHPPKRLKIAFSVASPIGTPVHADAIEAVTQTVKLLEELGHTIVEDRPAIDGLALAKDFTQMWLSQSALTLQDIQLWAAIDEQDLELDTRALAALGDKITAVNYLKGLNRWGLYTRQLNEFFQQYDLYLTPATASAAPLIGQIATPTWQQTVMKVLLKTGQAHQLLKGSLIDQLVLNNMKWVPFTQLANITGTPAMSVPLYWNKDSLPIGSQFIAPFGQEDILFALAAELEQAKPWSGYYQHIKV